MKKVIATLLLASTLMLAVTGCDQPGNNNRHHYDDDETTETTEEARPTFALENLPPVDATQSFGDYYVDDFREPWGVSQKLRMADGTVRNYFSDYAFDSNFNQVNQNMNFISTVSRPVVTVFNADKEGYLVYEVVYTQLFPICSKEPLAGVTYSFFSYHNVGYLDFYTGATFPTINLSTQIDSFSVTGNVHYAGETYEVGYYEYRVDEILNSSSETTSDGYVINRMTVQITSTSYFVVPDGYDGILMYVYIADDTDRPIEEVLADDDPYYTEPGWFGDDENVDDHVFFGISAFA